MASMKYCDKHNQVGFLKKPEESAGFAEIVDFLKGSHIRYALTHNPTIHDSLVKQFWQTATALTLADGTLELNVTIDTLEYIITEAYMIIGERTGKTHKQEPQLQLCDIGKGQKVRKQGIRKEDVFETPIWAKIQGRTDFSSKWFAGAVTLVACGFSKIKTYSRRVRLGLMKKLDAEKSARKGGRTEEKPQPKRSKKQEDLEKRKPA
ncbi:hypothetical protein Tco_0079926 [Tanacetum coccineum]